MNQYSLNKKIVVYHLIFIILFFPLYYAYANPAVLIARPLITRVLQSVITRRAALVAANDAVMLNVVRSNTMRYVGRVAANDSIYKVASVSSLRHAKDISWVSFALISGAITLTDLNVEGNDKVNISFEPTAVKLTDGRYAINVNGQTKVVTYNPTTDNPVIYKFQYKKENPVEKEDIFKSDTLNKNYKYYYKSPTGEFIMSNEIDILSEYNYYNKISDLLRDDYEIIKIGNNEYRYLTESNSAEIEYLRHTEHAPVFIKVDVRSTNVNIRLKSDFNLINTNNTGTEIVKTFNKPDLKKDYDTSTSTSVNTVLLDFNKNYVSDTDSDEGVQIGSIADLDLDLYQNKSLSLQSLAKLLNGLMLETALQQGYDGVPFSQENLITQSEIQTILNELGIDKVTFADLLTKAGTGNIIDINIENKPSPEPDPKPKPDPNEDYDDSEIEYPELEIPTAEQILQPYKSFFPFLQDFNLPLNSSQCPVWNVPFYGKDYKVDSHCPLIEQNRSVIESVFSLVWAFIALRKLLSA